MYAWCYLTETFNPEQSVKKIDYPCLMALNYQVNEVENLFHCSECWKGAENKNQYGHIFLASASTIHINCAFNEAIELVYFKSM